ncbi:tripartite tricarboxylate transporter TctB family protein [Paracoccus sp. MBLB3053]|uniref:Tripartite tricarboxylate transporter TctB family protein n=1 Tax=Paracoccus aurantius TaxID=3073814 RepID=A0ABU2HXK7_9RHOB|nr:tripartite tricarboxylate transporter TctB family protein [Paracoccus sp. MBLB3053]MDS9469746.1 tripartite tricarboxylate transporter TctB family protein [Paracoccus sp. MBLB3053]
MKLSDRIVGPGLILLGAAVILAAMRIPDVPGVRFGADLMPVICGCGFVLFGAVLTRSGLRDSEPLAEFDDWRVAPRKLLSAIWVVGGLCAGIVLFEPMGFALFGIIFMAGLMVLMGARPLTVAVIAPSFVLALYLVFSRIMFVDLPAGPLEGIL